ncbi:M20/M25/M40 family metallo-hydrolase [Methanoculleus sp. FWC-SCC3]|uniref:M20/M25/M40 family metallo-hydrolase n=1 Tax=Methanoculleus methanifontis TaxID=2584086 RepID=A0ABT8M0R4_9EURY|nr:M20/M25/M40 family metallo-hydrolase [Methanoculleus sp. FWC-SCC3]MDN7011466.1 M20/M25/M40 family metallo-hydrolase [Methanoculleus sp. FWC-SCC3]
MSADPSSPQFFGLSVVGAPIIAALVLVVAAIPVPACAADVDSLAGAIGVLTDYRRVPGLDDGSAADYIAGRLEECGYDMQQEVFAVETDMGPTATRNVVGIKEGFGQGAVVVCAHYDVPDPNCPGADDNAAGVAVMLEVARALQTEPLNRSVYFIAFSGEEIGLWGSADWLERHADLAGEIVAAVNLDCVARGDELYVETLPQYRWILDTVPESPTINPQIGSGLGGDHWRFWERHVPAVLISDNSGYTLRHTPDDTPEALNLSLATSCTEAVTGMVRTLASAGDATPPMVEGSVEEDGTIRYTISEPSITQLIIDGTDFGVLASGQVTLPAGPHTVRVVAYDADGNRGALDLKADVPDTDRDAPGSGHQPGGISIPWKRTEEDLKKYGMQHYGTPFVALSYDRPGAEETGTRIDGYVDGIRIAGLEEGHVVVHAPGSHRYEVVAAAAGTVVGYDETTYIVERMHDGPQAYYIKDSFVQEVAIREDALPLAPVACAVAASLLVVGYLFSRSVGSRRR